MDYERQILEVLMLAGAKGISVRMLTQHVYNMNCSLFFVPDVTEIRRYVQRYLLRSCKSPTSGIERMERRGYYRLNARQMDAAQQLMLEFNTHEDGLEDTSTPMIHEPMAGQTQDLFA